LAEAGAAVINIDATAPNDTTKHFSWDDHAGAFHLDYAPAGTSTANGPGVDGH